MITGDDGNVIWTPDRFEPVSRPGVFARQREIDEIARDSNVVDRARLQIPRDRIENIRTMDVFAFTLPINEAEAALACKLGPLRHKGEVQVRQVK